MRGQETGLFNRFQRALEETETPYRPCFYFLRPFSVSSILWSWGYGIYPRKISITFSRDGKRIRPVPHRVPRLEQAAAARRRRESGRGWG